MGQQLGRYSADWAVMQYGATGTGSSRLRDLVSRDGVFLGMGISSGGLPIDAGSQVCLCLIHLPTLTCLSPGTTRGRSAPPLHMPDPPRHIQKHQTSHPSPVTHHPSPITHHPSLLQFPPPLPSPKPSFPRTHTNIQILLGVPAHRPHPSDSDSDAAHQICKFPSEITRQAHQPYGPCTNQICKHTHVDVR